MAKRQKAAAAASGGNGGGDGDAEMQDKNDTSSRYEGIAEHNPSQYMLLETPSSMEMNMDGNNNNTNIQVT
ncbi:MAG: hypothetical protein SGARI_003656, partial [Bacillariaceae sp.]